MTENQKSRSERNKQKKKRKDRKPIWKIILLTLLFIFLAVFIVVGAVAAYWIATAPELDPDKLTVPLSTTILDKYGEPVAKLEDENREMVKYEDLPPVLIDAVTATEDARFFEHRGIDLRRLGAAVIANITDGFGSQGASTITHQVVENFFLSNEKKIKFKVQEQWLALKLEQQYSKEEIMEMYLNKIFYGNDSYGVVTAAQDYFGVTDLNELTLPQAAILAGLPQRPTAYNPHRNPELTAERMNTVLTLMVRHGKISEEEANEAREVDITSMLVEPKSNSLPYGAFIDKVEEEVNEKLEGVDINTAGLTVHTTLDPNVQEHLEFLLSDDSANPIPFTVEELDAAIVVMDTKTGEIQGIGGSRDDSGNRGTNYALETYQPGSTIKPLMAYGPAIEYDNMSTYHQINDDQPYSLSGTDGAAVRNASRSYSGWVSARTALARSLNVPVMKIFEDLNKSNVEDFISNVGLTPPEEIMATDAIGGATMEVSPLELAGAFRTFGNAGIYNDPYAVTSVEFPDGSTVDLRPDTDAAMKESTAYMVTDMLKSVMTSGTWRIEGFGGLPVAGKTGTTNLPEELGGGAGDYWFSGYTTNYTITTWAGNVLDDGGRRTAIPDSVPSTISQTMFREAMTYVSQGIETADFIKPDSVVEATVEIGSNPLKLASEFTPSNQKVTELFVKGTEPSTTSETFEELSSVSGLSSSYDEDADVIQVDWDYDDNLDVSFEVSASVDGGSMQTLSTTEDTSLEISQPESGVIYTIEVVVVSNSNSSLRSDPATTSITISEEDEIPGVTGLSAQFIEEHGVIDVDWSYDGPSAQFEVTVNGQTSTVESNGIEITGSFEPGQTYTIQVIAIGQENDNRGPTQSTDVTIPEEELEPEPNPEPEEPEEPEEAEPEPEPEEVEEPNEEVTEEEEEVEEQ